MRNAAQSRACMRNKELYCERSGAIKRNKPPRRAAARNKERQCAAAVRKGQRCKEQYHGR